jgi:hypothetical protein
VNIDFKRGELVSAARALLTVHMAQVHNHDNNLEPIFKAMEAELKRLVNNEFQFHGNSLGDSVQFALTILLMNGEKHMVSGKHQR